MNARFSALRLAMLGPATLGLAVSCVAAAALPSVAHAHGADANQIQIVLAGERAEVLATPPVSAVAFADADGDGRLTRAELAAERPAVLRALLDALWLADESGRAGDLVRADVSLPSEDDASGLPGREFVRLTVVLAWAAPPRALSLEAGFVREHPVGVVAQRAEHDALRGLVALVGAPDARVIDGSAGMITLLDDVVGVTAAPIAVRAAPIAVRAVPSTPHAPPARGASIRAALVFLVLALVGALGALATRHGLASLARPSTPKGHA